MSPDELDRRSRAFVYNSLVDSLSELKSTIVDGVYHDETLEVLRESHALVLKLLSFENLSPITNDPIEWIQVDEDDWQSTRNCKFFSKDGGESYYDLNDESRTLVLSKNVTG